MALSLDILTQITNVHWGGAIFSMASVRASNPLARSQLRHVRIKGKGDLFTNDGTGGLDATAVDFTCIAYGLVGKTSDNPGTPSFVACASEPSVNGRGYILHSKDAINWTLVYTQPHFPDEEIATGSRVWIVTWDGTQFWAGAHQSTNSSDVALINEYDILLGSAEGRSWSTVGTKIINFPDWPGYNQKTGLIVPHLDKSFLNTNGVGCPSCYFGQKQQDDNTKLTIRPKNSFSVDSLFGAYSANIFETGVTIAGGAAGASLGFYVTSVAYSNSNWMAVGQTSIGLPIKAARSIDDGKTWQNVPVTNTDDALPSVAGGS